MDKKCLECLVNKPKKDSLISNYGLQILNFKDIIVKTNEKSAAFKVAYEDEKVISTNLAEDLDKARKWSKRILIGGPLVGLAIGILITR